MNDLNFLITSGLKCTFYDHERKLYNRDEISQLTDKIFLDLGKVILQKRIVQHSFFYQFH